MNLFSKASWVPGSCRGEASRRPSSPPGLLSSASWCKSDGGACGYHRGFSSRLPSLGEGTDSAGLGEGETTVSSRQLGGAGSREEEQTGAQCPSSPAWEREVTLRNQAGSGAVRQSPSLQCSGRGSWPSGWTREPVGTCSTGHVWDQTLDLQKLFRTHKPRSRSLCVCPPRGLLAPFPVGYAC